MAETGTYAATSDKIANITDKPQSINTLSVIIVYKLTDEHVFIIHNPKNESTHLGYKFGSAEIKWRKITTT